MPSGDIFFILPFFICFLIFSLIPLIDTVRYSFFEYYRSGIKEIGPNFVGMQNYISLLGSDMLKYAGNTLILWVIGFVPQIVIALLLANWFTDIRLKIKGKQFFKVVIYLPNLIMASAFAMLFFAMFSTNGPINSILMSLGWISEPDRFPRLRDRYQITRGTYELPDVVWKYDDHAHGGNHGDQPGYLRGVRAGRMYERQEILLYSRSR